MATATTERELEELLGHRQWLANLARHLVGDPQAVEDVVQETWIAAIRSSKPANRSSKRWLAAVLRNIVRTRRRADDRRQRREAAVEERAGAPTDAILHKMNVEHRLAKVVAELPEPFRGTLLLRYYEGLNAADIAGQQQVNANTVRWRIKRGLELARAELDASTDGDRKAWCLALAPLTLEKPTWAAPTVTTLAKGAISMNAAKVAAATGFVAAAGLAVVAVRQSSPTPARAAVEQTEPPPPTEPSSMLAAAEPDAADDAVEQAEPDAAKPDKQPGRLNAAERERLLEQLRDARARRKQAEAKQPQPPTEIGRKHDPKTGEVPQLEKDYIREQMHELVEVFRECYNSRLVDQPDLAGTIKVEIALAGEPDVGGVVEDVAIIVDETTLNDPFLTECVQQTIYTLELPPPADGGTATIRYPIVFEPSDEE